MAQVTLYLDDQTAAKVKAAAKRAGLSRSQWLARLINERTATEWPAEFRELAGSWGDIPTARGMRRGTDRDASREDF